jgi:hypothetical protein
MNFSQLASDTQLKPHDLAQVLGIEYDTLLSIFRGKFNPPPGLVGDLVQIESDKAWVRSLLEQYDYLPHYKLFKLVPAELEEERYTESTSGN